MDHSQEHETVDGPWAGGWGVAAAAAVFAVLIASSFGGVGSTAMLIVGLVTFGVFGVLLGSGGVEVTVTAAHGDSHDGHGHH